jgi:hypothetical protein
MKKLNLVQLFLGLVVILSVIVLVKASSKNDVKNAAGEPKDDIKSSTLIVSEFEKSRLKSEKTRLSEQSSKSEEKPIMYERTSRSSYNEDTVNIFFVGKNQYEVSVKNPQIVQFGPRPRTIEESEPVNVDFSVKCDPKKLRQIAYEFATKYSPVSLSNLTESTNRKDDLVYFFRWENNVKKIDGIPAFIQIGITCAGDLVSYTNILDLKDSQINSSINRAAGVYIYANNGNNYVEYGPSRYWWTSNNEGYCSTRFATWCNPKYMKYTYESWVSTNRAVWYHLAYEGGVGTHKIFIPRVNGTTRWASYTITYDGGSSASFALDQLLYSDVWVPTRTLYAIANTWLSDTPFAYQSPSGKKIAFDEIQVVY